MRVLLHILVAFPLLLGFVLVSRADDDVTAIIDKAVKAHGVKGGEGQNYGYRGKNKGTLHVMGLNLEFTQEIAVQTPDKFKEVMELTVMNQKITTITVFNGKEGWLKANDMDIKVEKELLAEFKEVGYMMRLSQGMFLKDKALEFSLLGEVQVNDKPAVGVKVAKKGQKDINFYFDKGTGLMAKMERRARDFLSGQETTEERIIMEYQDVKGRKLAKKVLVNRDGKKLLDAEVIEAELVDRLDDSEFAKP
jgi:hypothetical protein